MKLSREQVAKIARLARLKLTDEETAQYQEQLSEVLTYIDQLGEVDTSKVPPTAQVTGQTNVMADDVVLNKPRTEELLAGAPAREGTSIKVQAVFGEDR
jgi:aspartyl-tRNA(Asn)/glutamyl-tRNA(Gln) amidotransferase subunit C